MNSTVELKQGTPRAFGAWVLACFLWGSALSLVKTVVEEYDPVFLVFARMAVACLILTPFVLIYCRNVRIARWRDLLMIIGMAICDPIGFFTFEAVALQYTSASQAGMLWAVYPMITVVMGWAILKERTTLPVILCFIVAMAGVLMLTAAGETTDHASNPILGNILELLSLACGAGYVIIIRFLRGGYPTIFLVWVQCLIAALVFLPLLSFDFVTLPTEFRLESFLMILYLGAGLSLLAQALSTYAIGRLPVAWVASIGNLIPVIGVLTGVIVLKEAMLPVQWVACGVVLGAVLLSQHFQRRSVVKESEDEKVSNAA